MSGSHFNQLPDTDRADSPIDLAVGEGGQSVGNAGVASDAEGQPPCAAMSARFPYWTTLVHRPIIQVAMSTWPASGVLPSSARSAWKQPRAPHEKHAR